MYLSNIQVGWEANAIENGTKIQSIEGVIPRNTGIKSLFPHPSTLIKDSDGNWIILLYVVDDGLFAKEYTKTEK